MFNKPAVMVSDKELGKFFDGIAPTPEKRKYQKEIYSLFGGRIVAFSPPIAKALKSIKAALFLGQLLYWHGRGAKEGWVYKTVEEFKEETGLSRKEQDTAIKILKGFKILEVERKGVPQIRHFRVDLDAVRKLLPYPPEATN